MKRKTLAAVLCMSMTLGMVAETGVLTHAAENQKAEKNVMEDTAESEKREETLENAGAEKEPDKEITEESVPEQSPESEVPENSTSEEVMEGENAENTAPEEIPEEVPKEQPEEIPEQPAVEEEIPKEQAEEETVAEEATGEKWWYKIEAENGRLAGTARAETPGNLGKRVTVVSDLDQGEDKASVTVGVDTEFEADVQMTVRYRSGDNRNLCYRVNDGEEQKWENLNSRGWFRLADTEAQTVHLTEGRNEIKFFASEGTNAPGIDSVTFSLNGGTAEDMSGAENMTVTFQVGNKIVKNLNKNRNETIEEWEIPVPEIPEGQDFLGWFWGPQAKYEGMFPLNLSELNQEVLDNLGGSMTFTARFGKHTPANPKEKEGYRLIFDEEFEGSELNETNWVDKYLSSWSTTAEYTKGKTFQDGVVSLQITEDTQPWCEEFDGQTVISGFTTGQRNGLHKWNQNNVVRNPEDTELKHINQYGYYEMRMKGQSGSSRHSAWWLLGFEDVPQECAEIDIFEVLGKNDHKVPPALHSWNDKDAFRKTDEYLIKPKAFKDENKDFNNEYHVYGFDWQQGTSGDAKYPDKIVFYVDGEKYEEINVNIDYPMIQLLSLYEKRAGGWTGDWEWEPYPNTMDIDYVRVYKKLPNGGVAQDNPEITEIKAEDLYIQQKDIALQQYENGYVEKNLPGTKSYVRVTWNDGVETQEAVEWEAITEADLTQLKEGNPIVKSGTVNINSIPGYPFTEQTTMTITPEAVLPYEAEGMKIVSDLGYLFDGKIEENDAKSAEFKVKKADMEAGNVSLTYNFKKDVTLSGIDMWTNFGQDQGIKSFQIAVWDKAVGDWAMLKDENGQEKVFTLDWQTKVEAQEKQSITFDPITTNKVKLIIKDAGLKWESKAAVREIAFLMQEDAEG